MMVLLQLIQKVDDVLQSIWKVDGTCSITIDLKTNDMLLDNLCILMYNVTIKNQEVHLYEDNFKPARAVGHTPDLC